MGTLMAACLQRSGQPVTLLGRHAQTRSITLSTPRQPQTHTLSIQSSPQTRIRHLMVTTKAQDAHRALLQYRDWIPTTTPILLLHNGWGIEPHIRRSFPDHPILLAPTTHGAQWNRPNHLIGHLAGNITLGSNTPIEIDPAPIQASLSAAGLNHDGQQHPTSYLE